ncbi:hypothetical protein [Dellaglioa algida]|uniref:hypothetical protein n=1 Tax=Dellaglioa algida TaxID=105612 RepID=UPI0024C4A303|nr:hypothetical protein [Dellaglioa algida]MDK1716616.1 hypothetical protein [Dellaglioa algida]MDK1721558.1 hypothetical protein [Dellaglioa algida]
MMKKFEIKMFDVNGKRRTLIMHSNDDIDTTFVTVFESLGRAHWLGDAIRHKAINMANIVEIASIEEVKE